MFAFQGPARITGGRIEGSTSAALVGTSTVPALAVTNSAVTGNGITITAANGATALNVVSGPSTFGGAVAMTVGGNTIASNTATISLSVNNSFASGGVALALSSSFGEALTIASLPTANALNITQGNARFAGSLNVLGDLNVAGAVNRTNVNDLLVLDNFIVANAATTSTSAGFLIQRAPTEVAINDSVLFTGTIASSTTVGGMTVTLAGATVSSASNAYSGMYLKLTRAGPFSEWHQISLYDGPSKMATLTPIFNNSTSDSFGSVFSIGNAAVIYENAYYGMIFDSTANAGAGAMRLCKVAQNLFNSLITVAVSGDVTFASGSATTLASLNVTNQATIGTGLTVTSGGITVTAGGIALNGGNLTLPNGTATIGTGLTVTSGGLTVTAGGATVTAGGIAVNGGNLTVPNGTATIGTGLTVTSGGITVTAGALALSNGNLTIPLGSATIGTGLTVTSGGLTVTAGGATVTAGGIAVNGGNLTVPNGTATIGTGLTVTSGGITVTAGALALSNGNLTIPLGSATIGTGLTVTSGGLTVTAGGATVTAGGIAVNGGNLTVPNGTATIGTGLTVTSGGITVTAGALALSNGNLTIPLGSATIGTGLTVTSGGLTVTAGGATVTAGGIAVNGGNLNVPNGNATIGTGLTVTAGGLLVSTGTTLLQAGLTVTGGTSTVAALTVNSSLITNSQTITAATTISGQDPSVILNDTFIDITSASAAVSGTLGSPTVPINGVFRKTITIGAMPAGGTSNYALSITAPFGDGSGNLTAPRTLTFDRVGQSVTLLFRGTSWYLQGSGLFSIT